MNGYYKGIREGSWIVNVAVHGERLQTTCDTELEAKMEVARFRCYQHMRVSDYWSDVLSELEDEQYQLEHKLLNY